MGCFLFGSRNIIVKIKGALPGGMMTIKVTLRELIGSTYSFNELNNINLRGKTAFKIARAASAVQVELDAYNMANQALRDSYYDEVPLTEEDIETELEKLPENEKAKAQEELGKRTKLEFKKDKSEEALKEELDDLLDTSVVLSIHKVPQKWFDQLEIKPLVLSGILWLFEGE
jgi:hypothetical protein